MTSHVPPGTTITRLPTTLSARAAERLAAGPLDAVTLMRDVCQVRQLSSDAAERMAVALLGGRIEFLRLDTGHWTLREPRAHYQVIPDSSGVGRAATASTWASASTAAGARSASGDDAEVAAVRGPVGSEARASISVTHTPVRTALHAVNFAVVDVETTGTRAGRGDRITEIAVVTVQNGAVADVYVQLVNPERSIPPAIMALTQITWEMVRDQPRFAQIAPIVSERLAGRVFTAHNAAFDWRFVSEELARASGSRLHGPRLCTVRMARALLPALPRRSLDHVSRYFGVDNDARHRAAGDAVATARVLLRMIDVAADRGIDCWESLDALVSSPAARRARTAGDRRRRAFPRPVTGDDIA